MYSHKQHELVIKQLISETGHKSLFSAAALRTGTPAWARALLSRSGGGRAWGGGESTSQCERERERFIKNGQQQDTNYICSHVTDVM